MRTRIDHNKPFYADGVYQHADNLSKLCLEIMGALYVPSLVKDWKVVLRQATHVKKIMSKLEHEIRERITKNLILTDSVPL